MMWNPIETAPKDGTRLLLWHKDGYVVSGRWHSDPGIDNPNAYEPQWAWWVSDNEIVMWDGGPDDHPSHWMPMPELPKEG